MFFQKEFQQKELPERSHTSCFLYSTPDDGSFPLHCHSYYEISYVEKGDRYELVNGTDNRLTDNSMVFIPLLAFHANRNLCATENLIIQFSPNFLSANTSFAGGETLLTTPAGAGDVIVPQGRELEIISELMELCRTPTAEGAALELKRNSLILGLVSAFLESGKLTFAEGCGAVTRVSGLDAVINYIIAHPDSRTDMKHAARIANMSYYSFSRMFKEVVGVNFSDYCNTLRIRLAEELLITTNLPVYEISARVGIETQSYFSRLFKQINGSAPAEYRAANRKR